MKSRPDPIEESLARGEREHADAPTNRRWFWALVVPFVLVMLLSMAAVLYLASHTNVAVHHAPGVGAP